MNLNYIAECLGKIDEIKIIGKDFSIGKTDYHFVGFYREKKHIKALIISYNEDLYELKNQIDEEILTDCTHVPTFRESERQSISLDDNFVEIEKIASGNTELNSCEGLASLLDNYIDDNQILLFEFIRAGWRNDKFFNIPFQRLYSHKISFSEEADSIADIADKMTLSFAPSFVRRLEETPITLNIGDSETEINLKNGKKIFIREIKLIDMYDEMEQLFGSERFRQMCTPEEIETQRKNFIDSFSPICPVGKYFIAVTYETEKNVSIEIKLKEYLDSVPNASGSNCMAFFVSSDLTPMHDGMKIKTAIIDTPFDESTKSVEAEIFTVTEISNIDDIIL